MVRKTVSFGALFWCPLEKGINSANLIIGSNKVSLQFHEGVFFHALTSCLALTTGETHSIKTNPKGQDLIHADQISMARSQSMID